MSQFIQLHLLTSYPPSNPNRDDLGRPKTAVMGGTTRMRISSQSLKRAWRTSDIFQTLSGFIGIHTKELAKRISASISSGKSLSEIIQQKLIEYPNNSEISKEDIEKWATQIAAVFVDKGKKKESEEMDDVDVQENDDDIKDTKKKKSVKSNINKESLKSEQIVVYSPEEISSINDLIKKLRIEKKAPSVLELNSILKKKTSGVDVAMFGRMLANASDYNIEASVQVAHAITVHKVAVEDDYFTAVDDLNRGEIDRGSAHMGDTEFSSGLFYLYICINKTHLIDNLNGNVALANKTLEALVEASATVAPSGKQNSFGNRVRASYILAERGTQQPRSLSLAFLKAVVGEDIYENAKKELKSVKENMIKGYGLCSEAEKEMDAVKGTGSLSEIKTFVREA